MMIVLNYVFFQGLWFACVLGAGGYGMHWLALLSALPLLGLTWFSDTRRADLLIALAAVLAGLVIDNLWVALNILSYPQQGFAPYWIALLWVGLGLTVNHSMSFFRDRPLFGSLLVGAFAPVTYLAGQRFGAVVVEDVWLTPIISAAWVVVFYVLAQQARRLVQAQPAA